MEKAGVRIVGYTVASLRKAQAVCVFAHAISGCFVFTDVLTVVEEDQDYLSARWRSFQRMKEAEQSECLTL